jgi:amino acid transporter
MRTGDAPAGGDASTRGGGGDEAEDLRLLDAARDDSADLFPEGERGGGGDGGDGDEGSDDMSPRSPPHHQLSRQLSAWDGVACNVGNMVGSGIFSSPGVVLVYAGSVGLGMLAWVLGAALAAGSALCYAELSAAMPSAGGDYAYLRAAFGSKTAFCWSWSMFFVIKSGSLAILGVTFATYTIACFKPFHGGGGGSGSGGGSGVDDGSFEVKALAMLLIVALTWVNAAGGVGSGARIQNVLTAGLYKS